ncbi:MAG TPA: ATP-dependent protease ATPase subunit HslU, partial [Chthonomonadales bacterium]|nr:ATP-dependent protease ATPase subunit HslU [Chthonomonadales bacterium]
QIVNELDKYIIGQKDAKRAVAVALRNRYRRRMLGDELRDEVIPKNILMIGATGVGKTEIARRLASLAKAPFIKVEATKFTEVGYVGRDVDSMVRDLVQVSIRMLETERLADVQEAARERAIKRVVDILQPGRSGSSARRRGEGVPPDLARTMRTVLAPLFAEPGTQPAPPAQPEAPQPKAQDSNEDDDGDQARRERIQERLRQQVTSGARDNDRIDITVEESQSGSFLQVFTPQGMEEMGMDVQSALGGFMPRKQKVRRVTIKEAIEIFSQEEAQGLIDRDSLVRDAISRAEQSGIIFVDELDKIAGPARTQGGGGPDVSREGVQRDILPIIEGSTVSTKYGPVRTDHVLFIAAGAFHVSKPSDLIPELQGRLPIRVELENLTEADFKRILTEPRNALTRQYRALMATEGVEIEFTEDAICELARVAAEVNHYSENIGARRLHTVLERLLEEISFEAPDLAEKQIRIDAAYVRMRLDSIVKNEDLSRYIL